jgi:hypothetical protein
MGAWLMYMNQFKRRELEQVKAVVTPEPKGKRSSAATQEIAAEVVAPSA